MSDGKTLMVETRTIHLKIINCFFFVFVFCFWLFVICFCFLFLWGFFCLFVCLFVFCCYLLLVYKDLSYVQVVFSTCVYRSSKMA